MEAREEGKLHNFYGSAVSDLRILGKRSKEWNLNDWRWDGDFLRATSLKTAAPDCRVQQLLPVCADLPVNNGSLNFFPSFPHELGLENGMQKRDLEKVRRYIEVNEEEEENGSLNLKLGGNMIPVNDRDTDKWEKSGKKSKLSGVPNQPVCQVEDCKADLSSAKDYHRRHKVCEVHSKASEALVGTTMQRFCQQCSRFHALEEFDEGKRSCRRRLAGHNKRRRKAHPENVAGTYELSDEQGAKLLLTSLLRILSNKQSTSTGQTNDQDLLSNILRNLANVSGSTSTNSPRELTAPLDFHKLEASSGTAKKDTSPDGRSSALVSSSLTQKSTQSDTVQVEPACETSVLCLSMASAKPEGTVGRINMSNIDLNCEYNDSKDCTEDFLDSVPSDNTENGSPCLSPWKESQRSSPVQNSVSSVSSQHQSPSTSSRESPGHTDRIVFKLFNKDPNDFPPNLRKQIFDWLSSSPTDIESYIRPGCVVLTIYARMDKSNWDELNCNLDSSLKRLLDGYGDPFWTTEWIYARVKHRASFLHNGQVVLDIPVPLEACQSCRISTITPIAVCFSESVNFVVKGYNLSDSNSRVLCALEGRYLTQEYCADIVEDDSENQEEIQSLGFSCDVPDVVGRGFIEVEDYCLNSCFFPFIAAEKDVCAEIRELEKTIEVSGSATLDANKIKARSEAMNFLHEMGWLLHKYCLVVRLAESSEDLDLFPFQDFKHLVEFALEHDWPAVMRKLLDVLLEGTVVADKNTSVVTALLDIGLLHHAVRKNSQSMVKFLLTYQPSGISIKARDTLELTDGGSYLFRPDATGPGGLTPLHIAAGLDDCDALIDSLTDDPESVGIKAWKNTRDSTGLTPHDCAGLRGHYSYIHLVQRKLNKKHGHVVVDIPDTMVTHMMGDVRRIATLETEKSIKKQPQMMNCKRCGDVLAYKSPVALYRPAMISMIAIAAVCVCAALFFKSSPRVFFSSRPFRWELLKYGAY